jgi:signal transduction histidine kinase
VTATGYRGDDRRAARSAESSLGRTWLAAGLTLVGVQIAAVLAVAGPAADLRFAESLASLRMAALVLAVALAVTSYFHWRAVGQAASLHVAMAGVTLAAVAVIGVAHPAGPVEGGAEVSRLVLAVASVLWFGRAALGPEVDSRLRVHRGLLGFGGAALAAVALGAAAEAAWFEVGPEVAGAVGGAWVVIGVVGVARAMNRSQVLMGWVSWAVIAIGLSEFIRMFAAAGTPVALLGSNATRASALLVAVIGASLALSRFAVARRGDVQGLRLIGRRREADRVASERDRAHEVRNALLAIEGAHTTLDHHRDRLSDQQRADLQRALRTGLANLRELLDGGAQQSAGAVEHVSVGHVVTDRALLAQSRGVPVEVIGDAGVEAWGRGSLLAQVMDNLVLNAERHGRAGPGRPVTIVVAREADRVVVQVMDRGPGVPVGHREAIFDAGHRVTGDGPGDGLGLHIARELMRQQSGHLRYEDRPGGGACFTLSLPAVEDDLTTSRNPGTHEVDDGR